MVNKQQYRVCLKKSKERKAKGKLSLCPRGYCSAKQRFDVYPSAYANAFAASVCKGESADYMGVKTKTYQGNKKHPSDLDRWFNEKWINVCEKGDGPGGHAPCGSGKGINNPEQYPYCRPYHRLPGTRVTATAQEMSVAEKKAMCRLKRSKPQGIGGKPTRVYVVKRANHRPQKGSSREPNIRVPRSVKRSATLALRLKKNRVQGGTETGWKRAVQLSTEYSVSLHTLVIMRAWFARHGPDARNGGTSYPGYKKWVAAGRPINPRRKTRYRGAVSWLLWGGDQAYTWLKTTRVQNALRKYYPGRVNADTVNRLM